MEIRGKVRRKIGQHIIDGSYLMGIIENGYHRYVIARVHLHQDTILSKLHPYLITDIFGCLRKPEWSIPELRHHHSGGKDSLNFIETVVAQRLIIWISPDTLYSVSICCKKMS